MGKFIRQKVDGSTKKFGNKKCIVDGINFDSQLEGYAYSRFKLLNIKFELKPQYDTVDSFQYKGETIRKVSSFPDFYLIDYDIIVDTKGQANDVAPLKFKLLKYHLMSRNLNPEIIWLKNRKEIDRFIVGIGSPYEYKNNQIDVCMSYLIKKKMIKSFSYSDDNLLIVLSKRATESKKQEVESYILSFLSTKLFEKLITNYTYEQ
jgi:hypothetical protein